VAQSGWGENLINITLFDPTHTIQYSNTLTITVDTYCYKNYYYLTWMNNLGGFDYWNFGGFADRDISIEDVTNQERNIFTGYPQSIGEFSYQINVQTRRRTLKEYTFRSWDLTQAQVDYIAAIKTSPQVQWVQSQYSINTILVDNKSFKIRKDGDKRWSVQFTAKQTDWISAQEV
jgi:hypothetical protein